ncbi:hypothetical protein OEZ86_000997 [Tetradesmus obliquus]|nr:hypothetical protein OEZ86_000997 [Tetradesmus obliquus]
MWLQQHQLIFRQHKQVAYRALIGAMDADVEAGDFPRALQLHNVVQGLDEVLRQSKGTTATGVVRHSIGGRLRRACAVGDTAAVAQLERLAGFAGHLATDLPNQAGAQANAAMQQLQQIVQELQQAGAREEEIAQIEAQAVANILDEQPQEQAEPGGLPGEDDSDGAVLRQLQARLDAGERSIPVPKQAQLGPLPLWQQCMLELVATHSIGVRRAMNGKRLIAYLTSGMLLADSPAAAGDVTPLQRLLGDAAFIAGPPVTPQTPRLPWGRMAAQAAVELRRPQLLAWALQPEQRQRLWGSAHNATKAALVDLMQQDSTPISNAVSSQPEQQRADSLQLQMHQQQLLPGRPVFAQLAAETALLLLNVTPNDEGLLSDWLQDGLQPGSSAADLARAKAVLAAVVATEQLPAGAQLMRRLCFLQVQRLGDVDLLALVVLWGHRLPQVLWADNVPE